ncbi:MAG: putative Ig domain-containing protein [Nitrospiraceae bacterium]
MLLLLVGCSESRQPEVAASSGAPHGSNQPPVIQRATVLPNPVVLSGPLSVQIHAEDPDRNPVTFRHRWFINGNPVEGETRPMLSPTFLKRGDRVGVEVFPFDGQIEGNPYQTDPVVVGNTPPEVTRITIEPTLPDRSHLRALAEGVDIDSDDIHYVFRWRRNGTLVLEGENPTLETGYFDRGDSITVEAIPHDAGGVGKPQLSEAIVLGNNAPKITSHPPSKFEKGVFVYGVQAVDDDKDSLKYKLDTAPPGMTIDHATGAISWQVAPDVKGTHRVRVVVQDGQGGSAFQEFELTLSPFAIPSQSRAGS